jgi:hypothetical protein
MNVPRFFCLGKPALIFSALLLAAGVGLADTVTVQVAPYANYGSVSPNYNGKNLTDGKTYSMTATAKSGFKFTGWTGSTNTSKAKISFAAANGLAFTANFTDTQKPVVTISAPANNSTVTQPDVVAMGTARDNDTVTNVCWQLISSNTPYSNTNFFWASTANGYKNWWANLSLEAGTNLLLVFAVDRSGNLTPLSKVKITYAAAVKNVAGITITVTNTDNYFITFSTGTNGTFSQKDAVGSYRYLKTGTESGKLWLTYIAPPSAVGSDTAALFFTGANTGVFSDAGDFTNSFTWAKTTSLALTNLNGAQIVLNSTNGDNLTLLSFFDPPLVLGMVGTSQFATNNPLILALSTPYPGNIGDRVGVPFKIWKQSSSGGATNYPFTLTGSVNGISSNAFISVMFDAPLYLYTKSAVFVPQTNAPLIIYTCYYTNYTSADSGVSAIVSAPFAYTNYSPAGSLLKLKRNGTNEFIILSFDNPTNFSGTYYDEAYGLGVTVPVVDSGTFGIESAPVIFTQPANVNTTNGGLAIFTVVASGSPPLTYQWRFNGTNLTDAGSITGSSTASLTNDSVTTADAGNYTVVVSNPFGVITNVTPAKLFVGVPPQFVGPTAAAITVAAGTTTNFYVIATGTLPLSYQWQLNNTNLPAGFPNYSGFNTTNLVISLATTNNAGNYDVVITNSFGQITNYMGNLTVTP